MYAEKQSDAATLSEVAFSVIVNFDFRLERWLDIVMPAPCPYFNGCPPNISTDSRTLRLHCFVKQIGGSKQIYDTRVQSNDDYEALGGQPAFFMWPRSMR